MVAKTGIQSLVWYVVEDDSVKLRRLIYYASLAFKLPMTVFLVKVAHRLKSEVVSICLRLGDFWRSTYCVLPPYLIGAVLGQRISPVTSFLGNSRVDVIRSITSHYLDHRFDLLGSGWVQVRHGMVCKGLEGYRYPPAQTTLIDSSGHWLDNRINFSNLKHAQSIWALVTPGYMPIDWQIDFKSGYRWNEKTWYQDIPFGEMLGVDIKVPWELARMQHLPQLAYAYALAFDRVEGFASPGEYMQEFRNQILDFIASNPPRYGANWVCTMDVGIRIANWLIARDLFIANGVKFDDQFEKAFLQSVYEHGKHIITNLEWHPEVRSNHYLSNIVGLLFVSVYLPCSSETDAWLAFAVQELIIEVKNQFYEDGGNFEASTSYHRLSAELVVYATALTVGLSEDKLASLSRYDHSLVCGAPKLLYAPIKFFPIPGSNFRSPFPGWYWTRLEKIVEFTIDIIRPDDLSPQFGDNDSGRLFKLQPSYETMTVADAKAQYLNLAEYDGLPNDETYLREESLDHRHLVAAANGLLARNDFSDFFQEFELETYLVASLGRGRMVCRADSYAFQARQKNIVINKPYSVATKLSQQVYEIVVSTSEGSNLIDRLQLCAYPDFGLYLFKSKRLYLAIRCGPIGLNGLGAHAHNDQLSIELWLDNKPVVVDGGSYLYTPLLTRRNEFRSITAHFSPRIQGCESGDLTLNAFQLGNEAQAQCVYFGESQFIGYYLLGTDRIYRKILIESGLVKVEDWVDGAAGPLVRLDANQLPYSPGYGWRSR